MERRNRILVFSLVGAAVAIGSAAQFAVRARKRKRAARGAIVFISRSHSDAPVVSCEKVHLYDGHPVTFLTDPADPDLDWVIKITDSKGTPFVHVNGKAQALFTPGSNRSQITARRPSHGQQDEYKYTVILAQYGTELDPKLIIH